MIVRKLPNGVNYKIFNENNEQTKIVHHNRLSPASNLPLTTKTIRRPYYKKAKTIEARNNTITYSSEISTESNGSDAIETLPSRRYPQHTRTPRHIDGTIPWRDIPDI